MVKKCLRAWILGPAIKLFFDLLKLPQKYKEEFNQPGHSVIQFISSTAKSSICLLPKRLFTTLSWTDNREPRIKTQRKIVERPGENLLSPASVADIKPNWFDPVWYRCFYSYSVLLRYVVYVGWPCLLLLYYSEKLYSNSNMCF